MISFRTQRQTRCRLQALLRFGLLFGLLLPLIGHAVPTHYLVLELDSQQQLHSHFHQLVDLPQPSNAAKRMGPYKAGIQADVIGPNQQTLLIDAGRYAVLRGEFGDDLQHDSHHFQLDSDTFVLRIPQTDAGMLNLRLNGLKVGREYSVAELVATATTKRAPAKIAATPTAAGNNRANLLVMGDGYTSSEQSAFSADANQVADALLSFEPYASYRSFFSVSSFFVASNESGADHPNAVCDDGSVDPLGPSFVDTAFDATFCSFGIQRLLTVDQNKVFQAAAGVPNWDVIIVVVNDETYGGSGGRAPVVSASQFASDVLIHEFGHSFVGLTDEYETPFPGFPSCSDTNNSLPACEPNATDQTVRAQIKWADLISAQTPIPTPQVDDTFIETVGLFQGARYQSSGFYRPELACNMRTLITPFCDVCRTAFVAQLYAGDWAADNIGVSLIDSSLPEADQVSGVAGVPVNFSVDVLQPTHGVSIAWTVDGQVLSLPATATSAEVIMSQPGVFAVSATVRDNATLTPVAGPTLPEFTRSWTLTLGQNNDLIFADGFEAVMMMGVR